MNRPGRSCAWIAPWIAPAIVAPLAQVACQGGPIENEPPTQSRGSWPVPAADVGLLCTDVGVIRACWDAVPGPFSGSGVARLIERTLPATPATSPMGWRCARQGPARVCVDRARSAPPFVCADSTCTQRHARMPDDGEWTCAEMAGATICAGGERAAGVAPAPADPAWLCGTRRGEPRGDGAGPRICVDFAPDFPDGNLRAWRCHQVNQPPGSRICERAPALRRDGGNSGAQMAASALLTDPCDRAHPCVDGSACVAGRCLPQRPSPSCWLDTDCPRDACRFGTCAGEVVR